MRICRTRRGGAERYIAGCDSCADLPGPKRIRRGVICCLGYYSEVSIPIAKLLSVYMLPQVSCTSSVPSLSDKQRYPAFLRTIPNDLYQIKAITKLMTYKDFDWNWVGMVYEDDDYGFTVTRSSNLIASKYKVCVAYQEIINNYLGHDNTSQRIKDVAQRIRSFPKVQVVFLILKPERVQELFKEMIQTNTSRTWIATDSWSTNRIVANMDNINQVGEIFGFTFKTGIIKGFDDYLRKLRPSPGGFNRYIEEYKNLRFQCTQELLDYNECTTKESNCEKPDSLKIKNESACVIDDPQKADDNFLPSALYLREAYNRKVAVLAIAHALHELLQCNQTFCPGEKNFPAWKLLEILRKVNFPLEDNYSFSFDELGDTPDGFDLIVWEKDGTKRSFNVRGRYHIRNDQIEVDKNFTVRKSRCSELCLPGSVKKVYNVSCCYDCIPCPEGSYTDSPDQHDCKKCGNGTWSLQGDTSCQPRQERYLGWRDAHPIALVASAIFGVLLLFVILIIFLVHRDSPPMKKAEVKLSCVMMAGLAVSFASEVCFMGRPNVHLCRARQVMFGLGFTLCVSCILVKAFRTFLAFLPFGQMTHRHLNHLYRPPVIVSVLTAVQVIICILWLIFDSPHVQSSPQGMDIVLQCIEGTLVHPEKIGFGCMLSYIALLAFVGFLLAFKGRKVPHEYSVTGYIIFSMLIYLFVWVCFIPVYIIESGQGSIVQASAILVSNYGIIFCHFLPSCYEALCGRRGNTLERWRFSSSAHSTGRIGHTAHGELDQTSVDSAVIPDVLHVGIYPVTTAKAVHMTSTSALDSCAGSTESDGFIISLSTEKINAPPLDMTTNPKVRKRSKVLRSQSYS